MSSDPTTGSPAPDVPERLLGWREWVLILLLAAIPIGEAIAVALGKGGDEGAASASAQGRADVQASLSLVETLGGADTVGYARAVEPRRFDFPADHGPHPDFRTEWWYFTGNLDAADGRRFGFQFTIFRSALAPPPAAPPSGPEEGGGGTGVPPGGARGTGPAATGPAAPRASPSPWSTRQMYLAHFTVTDAASGEFREFERFTRGAAGLAGAQAPATAAGEPSDGVRPFRVWLDDWELRGPDGSGAVWPMRLAAADSGVALRLELDPVKPLVLQGERGLSQKGPEPGNASYYYTYPRIAAQGTVTVDGEAVPVTGTAWLDREWSTSALSEGEVGWDWFSLQLDGGRELMLYQLRRADGTASPLSEGTWVRPNGSTERIPRGAFQLEVTGEWRSPVDGSRYPSGWVIRIPERSAVLTVTPVLEDQELDVSLRYWEGAVDVEGRVGDEVVAGRGYVELTGYAGTGS